MTVKPTISTDDRAIQCAALALDKKAYNVKVLDIRGISTIADYLVIATGTSDKQVVAIADSVRSGLKMYGKMIDMEGAKDGKWIVMDYGDVLVHVFLEEFRRYYDLDDLWSAAKVTEIPAEYLWEGKGE